MCVPEILAKEVNSAPSISVECLRSYRLSEDWIGTVGSEAFKFDSDRGDMYSLLPVMKCVSTRDVTNGRNAERPISRVIGHDDPRVIDRG
jgi:hypothetical protein